MDMYICAPWGNYELEIVSKSENAGEPMAKIAWEVREYGRGCALAVSRGTISLLCCRWHCSGQSVQQCVDRVTVCFYLSQVTFTFVYGNGNTSCITYRCMSYNGVTERSAELCSVLMIAFCLQGLHVGAP